MIDRFVALCLNRRQLVWLIVIVIGIFGYLSWQALAIEAYPDIADVTSQVITQYPGHAAEEVEEQVTVPLERELNGIPGLQVMRSHSTFGLSLITLVFRDGIDDYWARKRIQERIAGVDLPPSANPGLDALTSPIGEIYPYTLQSTFRDERELRELQEWVVIPRLKQVTGVADVTNFGGETTQFQLIVDPAKLAQYNVSLAQVTAAVQANNANAGGSIVNRGEQGYVVRGIGLVRSLQDLGNIVILAKNGTPVFLKNLGTLQLGALERRGILGKDKNPDSVSGIILLLRGMNPSQVLATFASYGVEWGHPPTRCKTRSLFRSHRTRTYDRPPCVANTARRNWPRPTCSSSLPRQHTRRAHGGFDDSFFFAVCFHLHAFYEYSGQPSLPWCD